MSQQRSLILLLAFLLATLHSIVATPVKGGQLAGQRVFLGYNGFNGVPRPPQASAGGELGAIFYIADAVDLAKLFSNGADQNKNYICLITADAAAWSLQPKVWVPPRIISQGGAAVDRNFVGSVLFANHAHPGLPGAPAAVHQMGIRQAQISRLQLHADCRKKATFANDHSTLNYPGLVHPWSIQTPAFVFQEITALIPWLVKDRI